MARDYRRMVEEKNSLSDAINTLQVMLSGRTFEGLSNDERDAMMEDVKKLNKHLEPMGKLLAEAPEGTAAEQRQVDPPTEQEKTAAQRGNMRSTGLEEVGNKSAPATPGSENETDPVGADKGDDEDEDEVDDVGQKTGRKKPARRK